MNEIHLIQTAVLKAANQSTYNPKVFFKTKPGCYGSHDKFLGIKVPILRMIAQQYPAAESNTIKVLLTSSFNEERLLGLFLLIHCYQKGSLDEKKEYYDFYLRYLDYVNNWNLVDSSAHLIIGAHLQNQPHEILFTLADSSNLWHRRIALVATWHFIKNEQYDTTLLLVKKLISDKEVLIHKAAGWMLREIGNRNLKILIDFLDSHATLLSRTTLRYAIERLDKTSRVSYLKK
jgi:3-methyladenine DNA glycosylase AlkD